MLSKFEVVYGHISVFCLNLTLEQGPLVVLARVPVDRPLARVPVCPEGREETYLEHNSCQ